LPQRGRSKLIGLQCLVQQHQTLNTGMLGDYDGIIISALSMVQLSLFPYLTTLLNVLRTFLHPTALSKASNSSVH
jgi:hypothetical protein